MSIEIFACSRGTLSPDPLHDAINAVCYAVEAQEGPFESKTKERGVILCVAEKQDAESSQAARFCIDSSAPTAVKIASSERELFEKLVMLVNDWDPDFLTGFEVQKASVGYLVDRANQLDVSGLSFIHLKNRTTTDEAVILVRFTQINLIQAFSRLPSTNIDARNPQARAPQEGGTDENGKESIGTTWGITKASGLWIHGRYILNLWRMARSEVS